MCLIAFAIGASARWPLVLASNRDEFFARPTQPLSRWGGANGAETISGRDLRAGGTWLGASPTGRVAWVTNVREAHPAAAPLSRGELVLSWLHSRQSATDWMQGLALQCSFYAGFNLVIGDLPSNEWHWLSNQAPLADGSLGWHTQRLPPGIHGLSNASLDTPWPKTTALKHVLAQHLADSSPAQLEEALWAALADPQRAPPDALPRTGVPKELEEGLSSAFVRLPGYGTRSSTLLFASVAEAELRKDRAAARQWHVQLEERTHAAPVESMAPVGDSHEDTLGQSSARSSASSQKVDWTFTR